MFDNDVGFFFPLISKILVFRHSRKKFGLLEKHKDYVVRAQAYHKKEDPLRVCAFHFVFLINNVGVFV